MKSLGLLIVILLSAGAGVAQSLKQESPFPLKDGINKGTSDSLVGTHYWYFYVTPGSNKLTVRFRNATTLYGASMKTALTVIVSDPKQTWSVTRVIQANPNGAETTLASEKVAKRQKVIVRIVPPNQNLLRMGGEYEIEATGNVEFDGATAEGDPIVRTYGSSVNYYGSTKFLADGTIIASDGSRGTWKVFDAENQIYTVVIGDYQASVRYRPGYGLVQPSEPNLILFQELKK